MQPLGVGFGVQYTRHRAPGIAQQNDFLLAKATTEIGNRLVQVAKDLLAGNGSVLAAAGAGGAPAAALIPVDQGKVLLQLLLVVVGKARGGIARTAVQKQDERVASVLPADLNILPDAA